MEKMWRTTFGAIGLLVLMMVLSSCGSDSSQTNVISGTVTDVEGEPVIDAEVFVDGLPMRSTRTLHNGTFYLTNVPTGFRLIRARAIINGVEYTGQHLAQVLEQDQSKNVNIMVARTTQQGTVEGFVRDALGRGIENARVFAGGALSSALARTDRRGFYRLSGLPSGYEYPIVASAPGYENDERRVEIYAGETSVVSFTLNSSRNVPVNAPQNLSAIAWTLPRTLIATRNARERRAYESIQQLLDPQRAQRPITRSVGNSWIEVSLRWDYERQLSLLGYGIYRGRTLSELQSNAIAFLRDPLADIFADLDPALQPNVTYFYEMVALNTDYLDNRPGSSSGRSNRVSVTPFEPISITQPRANEIVNETIFSWTAVTRADYYLVLVYDRFPDYQVNPLFPPDLDNPGSARVFAPSTSLVYTGPTLVRGRTYYLVVVAQSNDRQTRAISQIVPFQVR